MGEHDETDELRRFVSKRIMWVSEWTSVASGAAAAGDHADGPVLGARLVMSSSNDDASPGGGGGGGGGGGSGTCKLVLLVRGAVVTQGIRDVTHG